MASRRDRYDTLALAFWESKARQLVHFQDLKLPVSSAWLSFQGIACGAAPRRARKGLVGRNREIKLLAFAA